ncbi:HAD family hydrolase [Allobranchiibius sp. CTAmp26]|uniref:HAD family hydrolase n=1 Tax=Allobranchiibius sp. CTAmp26 TaxID=2815214 RepID=UPI001AA180BD|nr:HAD hydrolase-like protein [Allobranchiibius sp. CTAmp26]MBO1753625.1 HAD hydrolase-like protein [Allobranchiibius sp. CTAmp26]
MVTGVPFVVGFDLDMTLVDSRQGIVECMQQVLSARGVTARDEQLWPLIGAPLEANLGHFLPDEQVHGAADDYRSAYLRHAVRLTTALPGAGELVDLIHADGGRVLVVSAKAPAAVHAVLDQVGLRPDVVVGAVFAEDKAVPLRAHAARMYVGDHQGDMYAARAASAYAVGVTTGPHDEAMLREAGADAVVPDLVRLGERLNEFERAASTG